MSLLSQVMHVYPYLFTPSVVIGLGFLLLIAEEWSRQDADRAALWRRAAAFLLAGACSLLPTAAFALATGQGPAQIMQGNAWQVDALIASGIAITAAVLWVVWRRFEWGNLVPRGVLTLVLVTIPYIALSPFWNVSGHVIFAVMPTLYLTLVDRKYWPLLVIPIVMVPNRIYVDAHTWPQTIGGLLIAATIVVGFYWYRTGSVAGTPREEPRRID